MKKHHIAIALLLSVSVFLLAGCPHKEYTLTMSTKGNVLNRKLTVKFVKMKNERLEIANRIAKLYNRKAFKKVGGEVTFEGQFTDKTPNDIGGNGSVAYDTCQYGSVTGYVENFGGSDDLYEQAKTRLEAGDKLVDILQLTLKQKFADMDEFEKLDKFVNTQLRKDCKTLLLLMWTTQNQLAEAKPGIPVSESSENLKLARDIVPKPENTASARLIQFLVGHNYVSIQKVPPLLYDTFVSNSSKEKLYSEVLRESLVNKVGLKKDGPLTVALIDCIKNPEKNLEEAFQKAVKSTEGFSEFKKEYLRKKKEELDFSANPDKDIINEYTGNIMQSALGFGIGVSDKLTASLAVPSEPLYTNGKWYEDKKTIAWNAPVHNNELQAPAICYALWVEPNENIQKKQFGKVFLNGKDLMTYIAWSKGLTVDEAAQWNGFLKTLTNKNIESLLEFKFKGDEKPAYLEHPVIRTFYRAVSGKEILECK